MRYLETDKKFYKKLLTIALPIAAQSLITIGVNMMDNIMLGKLGEAQYSAASQANQFINMYHIFCMGIGMGASVLVSRFWGSKDMQSLRKAITIMLRLCVTLGLVFSLVTLIFPSGIMHIYMEDAEAIEKGIIYLNWSIPCYILMGLSLTLTIVLRSVGATKVPLIGSIFAFFINIFFNWVFIFGNLNMPRMEIAGAALGTLIARVFEAAFVCVYVFKVDKRIGYRIKHLFMKVSDLVREYIRVSIPVLISDGLLAFGNSVVAVIIGHLGRSFASAYAITTVTQQLSTVVIQGLSQSSAIITGHTLGRGDAQAAQRQGWTFFFLGTGFGALACALIMTFSGAIISMYEMTPETKQMAATLMRGISIIIMFQAANSILTKGVLRGGGDTRFLMLADILFLWVASIPLGALAAYVWGMEPFWIYMFLKMDQILKSIWCVFRLKSGKWIKRIKPASES